MGANQLISITNFGRTLVDDADAAAARQTLLIPRRNILINGDFLVAQRGLTIDASTFFNNNDDSYTLDRWVGLSDGNDILDFSRALDTDVPIGSRTAIKLVVQTINKKAGILQIIEHSDIADAQGDVVSLSFQAKTTTAKVINNIRAAVLNWDSTSDVVTSDVVSAWNAQGSNITPVANWTLENTPANLALTTSYQTFKIENISLDTANGKNVAVFIWIDDTDAASGDEVFIGNVQLVKGSKATDFEILPVQTRFALPKRFAQKTFNHDITPAQNAGLGGSLGIIASSTGSFIFNWNLEVELRANGTLTTFNPSVADARARNVTDLTNTPVVNSTNGTKGIVFIHSGLDATDANDRMAVHIFTNAEL